MAEAAGQLYCGECGRPVSSKFCTGCGAPAPNQMAARQAAPGLGFIADDIIGDDQNSFLRLLLRFAVAPVKSIIGLTDDPAFKRQWSFMIGCIGVYVSMMFFVLPKLTHVPMFNAKGEMLTSEILGILSFFIMTPLQYFACRAIGGKARSLRDYFKLCSLSVGYTSLLAIVSTLAFVLAGGLAMAAFGVPPNEFVQNYMGLYYLLMFVPAMIFIALSHRIFWAFGWLTAFATAIALMLVTWFALGPILFGAVHWLGLPALLQEVFG